MSSKGTTTFPVPAPRSEGRSQKRRPRDVGLRWAGVLIAAIGVMLLCLAAGDALAGVEIGGGGDNTLRGTAGSDRLAGFNGGDVLHGRAGRDALYGGAGDDELYAGPGRDDVLGGVGDDFFEAKDGATDDISCGPGQDSASVDRIDRVSTDCEAVYPG